MTDTPLKVGIDPDGFYNQDCGFACLVMIYGEAIGKRYALGDQSLLIGRTPSCDVQLADLSVSRAHCRVVARTNDAVVIDLHASNKTFVNGVPVSEHLLHDGDRLTVGRTIFRYLCNDNLETAYHAEVSRAMTTDPLTGAFNRTHFEKELDFAFYRFKRYGRPLSLVRIDMDDFKSVNARYGHLVGDRVLAHVGRLVFSSLRAGDILARWDGEEFALLLPETNEAGAITISERVRELVAGTPCEVNDQSVTVAFSMGVAELDSDTEDVADFIAKTAARLAEAKQRGGNRVQPPPET